MKEKNYKTIAKMEQYIIHVVALICLIGVNIQNLNVAQAQGYHPFFVFVIFFYIVDFLNNIKLKNKDSLSESTSINDQIVHGKISLF